MQSFTDRGENLKRDTLRTILFESLFFMVFIRVIRLIALISLLIIGVLFILTASILDAFSKKQTMTLKFAQKWYQLLLRTMNIHVELEGQYSHQGILICSNHISWLDIPVLGSVLPTYFLSKAELRDFPILGWLAHHAGTLFIQRGAGQIEEVKQLMQAYLAADHCLTFFPEATTGNGKAIRRFHPRLFSSAIETNTPILPVSIRYLTDTQPKLNIDFGDETMATNLWRVLGRWQTKVHVTLLPIINSENQKRKVLADQTMNAIAESLNLPCEKRGLDYREPMPK
jgi:1-acyl-sn-glycerol-3-phosphate acyltransferase